MEDEKMPVRRFEIKWIKPSTNRINTIFVLGDSKLHAINRSFESKYRHLVVSIKQLKYR